MQSRVATGLPTSSSGNIAPCLPGMLRQGEAVTPGPPRAPARSQQTPGPSPDILHSLETCLQLLFFPKVPVFVSQSCLTSTSRVADNNRNASATIQEAQVQTQGAGGAGSFLWLLKESLSMHLSSFSAGGLHTSLCVFAPMKRTPVRMDEKSTLLSVTSP